MRKLFLISAALLCGVSIASATQRGYEPTKPQTPPTSTTNNYGGAGGKGGAGGQGGTGIGVGVGIGKGGNASVKNSGNSKSSSVSKSKSKSSSKSNSSASVSNSGNSSVSGSGNSSVSIVHKERLQAPSFALGDGNSTAPCQGYTNFGGSFPGGGFGFGSSRTVKFCETEFNVRLYQQYFGTGVAREYLIQRDTTLARIVAGKIDTRKVYKVHPADK